MRRACIPFFSIFLFSFRGWWRRRRAFPLLIVSSLLVPSIRVWTVHLQMSANSFQRRHLSRLVLWVYGRKRENFHLICQSLCWNLLSAGNGAFIIIYFVVFLIHPFIESICIKDPLGMNLEYKGRGWGMKAKARYRLYLGETWVQCLHYVVLWVSPRGIPLGPGVAQNKTKTVKNVQRPTVLDLSGEA